MLEEMVQTIINKVIASDYPHLKLPAVVYAKVVSAKKCEVYDITDLIITDESTGRVFPAHITANCYEYRLTVIDRFGNAESNFPALPGIKSKKQFQAGAVVAVALAYGDIDPVIIGEVSL